MSTYMFRTTERAEAEAPLLFVFHGTGGDENQFFELGKRLVPGAAVVAPRGDVSEHGALRFFRRTGEGVYDMDDFERATVAMIGFVRERSAAHGSGPLLGLGYSNGANILCAVQARAPNLFAATALLHPLIPFALPPAPALKGRPVLITAGRRDPIAPLGATEALGAWYRAQGAALDLAVDEGGHELREEEMRAAQRLFAPFAKARG